MHPTSSGHTNILILTPYTTFLCFSFLCFFWFFLSIFLPLNRYMISASNFKHTPAPFLGSNITIFDFILGSPVTTGDNAWVKAVFSLRASGESFLDKYITSGFNCSVSCTTASAAVVRVECWPLQWNNEDLNQQYGYHGNIFHWISWDISLSHYCLGCLGCSENGRFGPSSMCIWIRRTEPWTTNGLRDSLVSNKAIWSFNHLKSRKVIPIWWLVN